VSETDDISHVRLGVIPCVNTMLINTCVGVKGETLLSMQIMYVDSVRCSYDVLFELRVIDLKGNAISVRSLRSYLHCIIVYTAYMLYITLHLTCTKS
jgi:hypothetical protein